MAFAVGLDVERLFALGSLVTLDDDGARLLVLSMGVDGGFYLLLTPVAALLPIGGASADFGRIGGLAYGIVGAGAAVALVLLWPPLFARHDAGDVQAASEFRALTDFIVARVWNLVCAGAGAAWWLAVWHGARPRPQLLGAVSLALGVCSAADALCALLHLEVLGGVALALVLVLLPVWCLVVAYAAPRVGSPADAAAEG